MDGFCKRLDNPKGEMIGLWVANPNDPNLETIVEAFKATDGMPVDLFEAFEKGRYRTIRNRANKAGGAFLMFGNSPAPGARNYWAIGSLFPAFGGIFIANIGERTYEEWRLRLFLHSFAAVILAIAGLIQFRILRRGLGMAITGLLVGGLFLRMAIMDYATEAAHPSKVKEVDDIRLALAHYCEMHGRFPLDLPEIDPKNQSKPGYTQVTANGWIYETGGEDFYFLTKHWDRDDGLKFYFYVEDKELSGWFWDRDNGPEHKQPALRFSATEETLFENFNKASEAAGPVQCIVAGEVQKPGPQPIKTGETLTLKSAVSRAGGVTELADTKKVQITRQGKDGRCEQLDFNLEADDPIIRDGDRISIWRIFNGWH